MKSRLLLAASAAMAFATPAAADSAALSIVIDGATHVFAPQMDGARTGFTRFTVVDAVSIEGADGPARLVLELAFPPGARTGAGPHDARISFRPDGWQNYWVSPPDLPIDAVTVDHLDLSGPDPRIVGRFVVPLCFTPSPLHTPDAARCVEASGRFDTALVRD